jgi:AcrR family transcriptional regulator
MVRKTTFTKDDVISAAIAVIDAEGLSQLTARKVADKMGASTAPVYSNFENMDQLGSAAKVEAIEIMLSMMVKPEETQEFLSIGEGVLLFAKKHPRLYDALFLQPATMHDPGPQVMERILEKMATIPDLKPLQPVERLILLKKLALFTHGMATEICNGFLDIYQWRELVLLLDEVGSALVEAALNGPPRNEKDTDLLGSFWSMCHNLTDETDEPRPKGDLND